MSTTRRATPSLPRADAPRTLSRTNTARTRAHPARAALCRVENVLYLTLIVPLVAFLPAPLAYGVARWRGAWRFRLDAPRRTLLMRNLHAVLGNQLSPAERATVARDFFRRVSCQAIDEMRLHGKGRALRRLVEVRGVEHLTAALAGGKGVILATGHVGSFAAAYSLIGACGFPVTAVGNWESTDDPRMSRLHRLVLWLTHRHPLAHHHRRPQIEPTTAGPVAAIRIAEVLRANEVVAIPIDAPVMDPRDLSRTVQVAFLGHHARLLPGTTLIAQRTGAPVLVATIVRSADWRHQVLDISAPIPTTGDPTASFSQCVAAVEASIRRHLAHWDFWDERHMLINLGLVPGVAVKAPAYWDFHPLRRPRVAADREPATG